MNWRRVMLVASSALLLLGACDEEEMRTQPRAGPFDQSPLFWNGSAARPWPDGAVPRTADAYEPDLDGRPAPRPPSDLESLRIGQARFNTFCSPCHGWDGYGDGLIPRHGFPAPPSLHDDPQRSLSDEDLYRVITQGLGKMPPYRDQVVPRERWAVVAYIRALQLSQHARPTDAPEWSGENTPSVGGAP